MYPHGETNQVDGSDPNLHGSMQRARPRVIPTEAQRRFAEFMQETEAKVHRCIYALVGHRELAKDLTQNTFVNAYRAWDRYDARKGKLAWILKIARNIVRSHWREDGAQKRNLSEGAKSPTRSDWPTADAFGEGVVDGRGPDAHHSAVHNERLAAIHSELDRLSGHHRSVLLLTLAGQSDPDIAAEIGGTPGAIATTRCRIIAQLREVLSKRDL